MVGCKVAVSYSKCSPMVVNPPPPHPSMEISNDQMTLWNPAPSLEKVMRVCAPMSLYHITHTRMPVCTQKHILTCTHAVVSCMSLVLWSHFYTHLHR